MCLGIPGQVVSIQDSGKKIALVDVGGVRRPVNLACVVDAEHPIEKTVGDWVLVHVGFAMGRLDERQAKETLALLTELGEAQQEIAAMQQSGAA